MTIKELLGSWNLVNHGTENSEGVFRATSDYLKGQLIYNPDGSMSVLIVTKENPESLRDIISYAGRFSFEADRILHHVEVSPDPNRRGTTELRFFKLSGSELQLSTSPGPQGRYVITWVKKT